MSKQEEIREEVARKLYYWLTGVYRNEDNFNETTWEAISEKDRKFYREDYADPLMKSLHSQGVVIKVERELPKCPTTIEAGLSQEIIDFRRHSIAQFGCTQIMMLEAGYVAVEPLIAGIDGNGDSPT